LGISTSGKALNVYYAAIAARSLGLATILLTGERESRISNYTDIAIHAPARQTDLVQEYHITLYHCLCGMLEQDFFA
jgi:D-sedoheptulose 7-phosphate isomerase